MGETKRARWVRETRERKASGSERTYADLVGLTILCARIELRWPDGSEVCAK